MKKNVALLVLVVCLFSVQFAFSQTKPVPPRIGQRGRCAICERIASLRQARLGASLSLEQRPASTIYI